LYRPENDAYYHEQIIKILSLIAANREAAETIASGGGDPIPTAQEKFQTLQEAFRKLKCPLDEFVQECFERMDALSAVNATLTDEETKRQLQKRIYTTRVASNIYSILKDRALMHQVGLRRLTLEPPALESIAGLMVRELLTVAYEMKVDPLRLYDSFRINREWVKKSGEYYQLQQEKIEGQTVVWVPIGKPNDEYQA